MANNRIAYGIAKQMGIDTSGMTPQEVWKEITSSNSYGGKGYSGYSMSNNAVDSYKRGKKPLSKWSRQDIIDRIKMYDEDKVEMFKDVPTSVLKTLLSSEEWHHTSNHFNKTDFYDIDVDKIEEMTTDKLKQLVAKDLGEKQEEKEKANAVKNKIATARITYKDKGKTITEDVNFNPNDKVIHTSKGDKKKSAIEFNYFAIGDSPKQIPTDINSDKVWRLARHIDFRKKMGWDIERGIQDIIKLGNIPNDENLIAEAKELSKYM